MATTTPAEDISRTMDKAVDQAIALSNMVRSLKEVYQPNGEPIFRPSPATLETLRLMRGTLNAAIDSIESIT